MIARGFPADYAELLADLHADHPGWEFEALKIGDLAWNKIVDRECKPSLNLVARTDWAPEAWAHLKGANYTPYYAENAKAYDSGAWYQASRAAIAYFMDPRNFLNERDVFMFETLGFNALTQTKEIVERTLAQTFMANAAYDGGTRTFSDLLLEVGRKHGISPVFLAGRLASEQGRGTVQARGTIGDSLCALYTNRSDRIGKAVIWGNRFTRDGTNTAAVIAAGPETYNGYYNFFNVGACGSGTFEIRYNAWREAVSPEVCEKYCGPWTTQARAIEGGAIRLKERYVGSFRHTRYFQKFSVVKAAGPFRWSQYMQNIGAPLSESRNTFNAYNGAGTLDAPYRFVIPVYVGMPDEPCPDPADGNSVYSPSR